MNLSVLIAHLQNLQATYGDLEVFQGDHNNTLGSIAPARLPSIREVAKLKSRERNPRVVLSIDSDDVRTGRMIVYVGK